MGCEDAGLGSCWSSLDLPGVGHRGLRQATGRRLWSSRSDARARPESRPSCRRLAGYRRWADPAAEDELVRRRPRITPRTSPRQPRPPARGCHPGRLPLRPPARRHAERTAGPAGCPEAAPIRPDARSSGPSWSRPKPGDASLLPAASALASYDPDRRQVGGSRRQGGSGVGRRSTPSIWARGSKPCVPCVAS